MSPPRPPSSLASFVAKGLALGVAASIAAHLALRSLPWRPAPAAEPAGFALGEPLTAEPPARYAEPGSHLYEPPEPAPGSAPSEAPAPPQAGRRPLVESPAALGRRPSAVPTGREAPLSGRGSLSSFERGTPLVAGAVGSAATRPAGPAARAALRPRTASAAADRADPAASSGGGPSSVPGPRAIAGDGPFGARGASPAAAAPPGAGIHGDAPPEFAAIRSKLVRSVPLTEADQRSAMGLAQEEMDRFAELADSAHGDVGPSGGAGDGWQGKEPPSAPAPPAGARHWPLGDAGAVTQNFGCTGFYLEPPYRGCPHFHEALDIAVAGGTPIRAFEGGKVIEAVTGCQSRGDCRCYGNHVVVAHPDGLTTLYAHMQSAAVTDGQPVSAGQTLGYEGTTGCSTGPHVHFVVRRSRDGRTGEYVDPRDVLP